MTPIHLNYYQTDLQKIEGRPIKSYIAYKKWWIEHHSYHYVGSPDWGHTPEECFETHVNEIGLYTLMETLVNWVDEE